MSGTPRRRCSDTCRGYPTCGLRDAACRRARLGSPHERRPGLLAGRAGLPARRRCRRAGRDLAEPGGRLHDLPVALPVPHRRPAARAVLGRRRARHARPQGARGPLLPARRPSARPSRPGPCWCRPGRGWSDADPSARRDVRRGRGRPDGPGFLDWLTVRLGRARPLLRAGGPSPPRARRARALRRDAARLQAAAARVRRPARRRARRGDQSGRLQDGQVARTRTSRPRRCSR